jgi:hypothetical protein
MPRSTRNISVWAWVAAYVAVTSIGACGQGSSDKIVAKVGEHLIAEETFAHWLSVEESSPDTIDTAHDSGARRRVMESLISAEWIVAQASALGVSVSANEAEQQLSLLAFTGQTGPSGSQLLSNEVELRRLLANRSLTYGDRVWLVRLNLLSAKIRRRERLLAERQVTHAQVVRYFKVHRPQFVMPEVRDYVFIPTHTRSASLKARREIEAGDDFFSVQKRISIDPPELSGLRHLKRGEGDPVFTARVFRARPHVLLGPTPLAQIWDVYEVRKIRPRHQRSLTEVEASIKKQLATQGLERAPAKLADLLARTWKARTRCSAGYVVRLCGGKAQVG